MATVNEVAVFDDSHAAPGRGITHWLSTAHPTVFSLYCIAAAFGTYFCMYAFRKPFTAATYDGVMFYGIGFKTILISSQVAGYTLSKFIGIKVVSEMPAGYRATALLVLIGIAEIALVLFAITPAPWNFVWLFVNGLPLGMVFGLVLGFLEGRAVTEALSAGLCASFIVSSGFVKSVGRSLISTHGVDTYWMPCLTGLIFIIPLLFFVWMLSQIPPPSAADESLRCKRAPMNHQQRRDFWRRHAWGLTGLLSIYVLLTLVRSLRDDFAVEIWSELGVRDNPAVFARSEFWVMVGVIAVAGLTSLVRNNRTAFLLSIGVLAAGFVVVIGSVIGQVSGQLSPMAFMVLLGLGLYLPYVAFHTTVFERMIAVFRETGTLGYLMYLADALGYLSYVAVMIFRNTFTGENRFLPLLIWGALAVAVMSSALTLFLFFYFSSKIPSKNPLALPGPK